MSKLVKELQKDCLNTNLSLANLLRKARFIAQKLNIKDMVDYCTKELEGYTKGPFPEYRYISVSYKAYNPYRAQWIPYEIPSNSPIARILKWPTKLSISEMNRLLEEPGDTIVQNILLELQRKLQEWSNIPDCYEIKQFFPKATFSKIFDIVRNKISDWAVELEKKGILGDEYEFSPKEKEIAKNMTIINNYGNINGSNVVGSAINSTLNANGVKEFDYEGTKKLLESIKELIKAPSVDENDRNLLNTQIEKIDQKINQKDSKSIGTLLNSLGVWAQSITCSVIGSDIYNKISAFLKTIQ